MFPIKYIENNLVFNHDGECFAYYELTPYNYSFLSPEEKYMVHDNFRQLIARTVTEKSMPYRLPQRTACVQYRSVPKRESQAD